MRITKADYCGSAYGKKDFPTGSIPEIAIVGRSNAGKSSVINCLANRKHLARTGQTPGVTTALHFFSLNDAFLLVDLPGYGFAKVSQGERERWKGLIESYLTHRATLRLALMVMDARRFPDELDSMMVDWLRAQRLEFLVLANKADKMNTSEQKACKQLLEQGLALDPSELLLFSARTGLNLGGLWSRIGQALRG